MFKNPMRIFSLAAAIFCVSCGTNMYKSAAKKDGPEATLEAAKIALDNSDYTEARSILSTLWESNKSSTITELLVVSKMAYAGFNFFDIISKSLTSSTSSSGKAGNSILSNLKNVLTTDVSTAALDELKDTLNVIAASDKPEELAVLKCFSGGIYSQIILTKIDTELATLSATLKALPTRLSAASGTCTASNTEISKIGADLKTSLDSVGTITTRISTIVQQVGSCLQSLTSGTTSSANSLQTSITNLVSKADKGCTVPSNQLLGSLALPSCMNSFVTSSTAKAGDGVIDGCEFFVNCTGGSCFN